MPVNNGPDADFIEYVPTDPAPDSSPLKARQELDALPQVTEPPEAEEAVTPEFAKLRDIMLPPRDHANRARLQVQSPNRLFFYWSLRVDPYRTLKRAVGGDPGSYTLVVKLIEIMSGFETMQPAGNDGEFWFDVEAGSEYRAEIGFYAPNRPYFRILYSNTVFTPRRSPSPRPAETADWALTADKFSRVLDVAGFARDAFEVAMAGDDPLEADTRSRSALSRFTDASPPDLAIVSADEIRFVLLTLAAGGSLDSLYGRIGPALMAVLQENRTRINAGRALSVIRDEFGIETDEMTGDEVPSAVFGSSLVNFPPKLRRRIPTEFNPISSPGTGGW
ncbi:MAG: DUF4912 domain-containing protein [Acidobacteriota bacterium]